MELDIMPYCDNCPYFAPEKKISTIMAMVNGGRMPQTSFIAVGRKFVKG